MPETPNAPRAPKIVLLGEDRAADMLMLRRWLGGQEGKIMTLDILRAVRANVNEFIRIYGPDTIGSEMRGKTGHVEGGGKWTFRYNEEGSAAELIIEGVPEERLYGPKVIQEKVEQRVRALLSPSEAVLMQKAQLSQGNLEHATEDQIRSAFLDAKQDPIGQDLIVKGILKKEAISAAFLLDLLGHVISPEAGRGLVQKLADAGAFRKLDDPPVLKKLYTAVILDPLSEYFALQYESFSVEELEEELQKRLPSVPIVSWTMARRLAQKMPSDEFASYVLQHPQFFGSDNQRMMILRTMLTPPSSDA